MIKHDAIIFFPRDMVVWESLLVEKKKISLRYFLTFFASGTFFVHCKRMSGFFVFDFLSHSLFFERLFVSSLLKKTTYKVNEIPFHPFCLLHPFL